MDSEKMEVCIKEAPYANLADVSASNKTSVVVSSQQVPHQPVQNQIVLEGNNASPSRLVQSQARISAPQYA